MSEAFELLLIRLLRSIYVLLPYELKGVQQHRFNLLNPLGWIVILIIAIGTGVWSSIKVVYGIVTDALVSESLARTEVKGVEKAPKQAKN